MIKDPNIRSETTGRSVLSLQTLVTENIYELDPKGKGNEGKTKWMGPRQTEKLLHGTATSNKGLDRSTSLHIFRVPNTAFLRDKCLVRAWN